jgi:hypothetical protein
MGEMESGERFCMLQKNDDEIEIEIFLNKLPSAINEEGGKETIRDD